MGLLFVTLLVITALPELNFILGSQAIKNSLVDAALPRPEVIYQPNPRILEMNLLPMRLVNLNVVDGYMEVTASLVLKWNYSIDFGKVMVVDKAAKPWLPDIIHQNGFRGPTEVQQTSAQEAYSFKRENQSALVTWQFNTILKSPCAFDLQSFPYDTQTCVFSFTASSNLSFTMDLIPSREEEFSFRKLYYVADPEWEFISTDSAREFRLLPCWEDDVAHLDINVTFRRESAYYYERLVIPALLIAFILPFIFLLHPENRDRVVIYVIFFALLLYLMSSLGSQIGDKFGKKCRLVTYYRVTMVIDVVCMVLSIVIIQMYSRGGKRGRVPSFFRQVFLGCGNSVCLLDEFHVRLYQPPPATDKKDKEKASTSSSNEVVKVLREQDAKNQASVAAQDMRDEWRQFTLTLDRIFFFVFFFIFIVYTVAMLG